MADGRSKEAFIVIIYLISRDPLLIFNNLARKGRATAIWIIRSAAAHHLGEKWTHSLIIIFLMTNGKMSIIRLYRLFATKVILLIIVLLYEMELIT